MATHFLNLPLATTLVLVLVLFLSPTSTTGIIDTNLVLDYNGDPLEVGSEYYIQPVIPNSEENGGPILLSVLARSPKSDTSSCPLYVVETPLIPQPSELDTPVKFIIPANKAQTQVTLSSRVIIDSGPYCGDQGFWRVRKNKNNNKSEVLAAGDLTIRLPSLFTIKPTEISTVYKIAYYLDSTNYFGSYYDSVSGLQVVYFTDSEDAFPVVFVKKSKALANM